jgi:hypothetical protein
MARAILLTVGLVALAGGCFEAPQPPCAFLCGEGNVCPDGYACAPDGWCKRDDVAPNFSCGAAPSDAAVIDAVSIDATPLPDGGLANGQACTTGTECESGNCSDDVCCDTACSGDCDACSTAAGATTNGTCALLTSATTCRAAAGECDQAETCTGSSATCPGNSFRSAGTQCTDSSPTDCSDAQCNGAGACNQTQGFESSGTACGSTLDDDCTNPDTCNSTGTCLSNHASSGVQCADTDTTNCDDAQCNGTGTCVQDFAFEAATTPCGSATDTMCTNPDTCNAGGVCLANHEAEMSPCSEMGGDTCCVGVCVVGPGGAGTCP